MTRDTVSSAEDLEIAIRDEEEGVMMRLCGRLTIASSPAFRDRLLAKLQMPSSHAVIVDFSNVTYVDSSGIATLIEGLKMARQKQTTLCLRGLQGRLLHLFQVTGMSTLFEKNCRESALSASKVS